MFHAVWHAIHMLHVEWVLSCVPHVRSASKLPHAYTHVTPYACTPAVARLRESAQKLQQTAVALLHGQVSSLASSQAQEHTDASGSAATGCLKLAAKKAQAANINVVPSLPASAAMHACTCLTSTSAAPAAATASPLTRTGSGSASAGRTKRPSEALFGTSANGPTTRTTTMCTTACTAGCFNWATWQPLGPGEVVWAAETVHVPGGKSSLRWWPALILTEEDLKRIDRVGHLLVKGLKVRAGRGLPCSTQCQYVRQ